MLKIQNITTQRQQEQELFIVDFAQAVTQKYIIVINEFASEIQVKFFETLNYSSVENDRGIFIAILCNKC